MLPEWCFFELDGIIAQETGIITGNNFRGPAIGKFPPSGKLFLDFPVLHAFLPVHPLPPVGVNIPADVLIIRVNIFGAG